MSAPTSPDPYRIKRFMNKLERVWLDSPSLSLCEILNASAVDTGNNRLETDDEQIEKYLDTYLKEHSLSAWKS